MRVHDVFAVVVDEGNRQNEVAQLLWHLWRSTKSGGIYTLERSEELTLLAKSAHRQLGRHHFAAFGPRGSTVSGRQRKRYPLCKPSLSLGRFSILSNSSEANVRSAD